MSEEKNRLSRDPYQYARKVFFNRWKPYLLHAIDFDGATRFSRFGKQIPITEKVLTANLRELERDGLIVRTVYAEVPVRVEYTLTEQGKSLIPILDSIFGNGIGSFMGAFYVIAFHLFIWTWGIMILARGREDIKLTPKKIFFNYGTVPCAIGLVIFLFKGLIVIPTDSALMPAVKAFGSFFGYLGSLCTPISVLVTGALLATISLPKMFTNAKLYLHSAIKLVAFPVIICLLAKLILSLTPLSPEAINVYVLLATAMAGVPSAATITMLAELYDIEPAYASQSVGMTSILSTATLPLVMLFAQWILTF